MTIFLNNLRRILCRPANLLCMLVVPVVLSMLVVGLSGAASGYTLGVLDSDGTELTKTLTEAFGQKCDVVTVEADSIRESVINNDVSCAIEFQEGFTAAVLAGEEVYAKSYSLNDANGAEPAVLYINTLISAAKNLGAVTNGDEAALLDALDEVISSNYQVRYEIFSKDGRDNVENTVTALGYVAVGMMFLMTFASMLLLEDKKSGVFDRILTTQFPRWAYYVQHLLSYFTVALIQICVEILLLPNFADVSFGADWMETVQVGVICCSFACVCIAIGITVSRFAKTSLMAGGVISMVNIPMLMIGGCFWPKEIMPEFMQTLSNFMPTAWFLNGAEKILDGKGFVAAAPEIAYLLGLSALLLVIDFSIKPTKVK